MSISATSHSHTQVSDHSGETNTTDLAVMSANVDSNQFADEPVSIICNAGGPSERLHKGSCKAKNNHKERSG